LEALLMVLEVFLLEQSGVFWIRTGMEVAPFVVEAFHVEAIFP
jgi:hypothetical protein